MNAATHGPSAARVPAAVEQPVAAAPSNAIWGSDVVADLLRALDIPYVCLNPGASFRGLHDSLVNRLGNERPQMLLCLHEEHAVAIAQGYAKVTGRPLAAIVHSNVGLMHATMAIFNAWCDRVPVLVIGATGPVDAAKRRPWIDWIHTARDQGALVRPYVKWDDQPASAAAALESVLRAHQRATTLPMGPVYVCLDAALQEERLTAVPPAPDVSRYAAPPPGAPDAALIARAAALLDGAKAPMLLAGRVSRGLDGWNQRIALAERLGARVLTDGKVAAAFPTDHRLHVSPPAHFLDARAQAALREADVVLSLDWLDLAGTLKQAYGDAPVAARVIHVSLDHLVHNGWSMDHQALPAVDVAIAATPEASVSALLAAVTRRTPAAVPSAPAPAAAAPPAGGEIEMAQLAAALARATAGRELSLVRLPLGWSGELWHFRHPLDYLGTDGGAGIGSGPGNAVGAALALAGSGRVPVAVVGDGDFLMGATALWTAARYAIAPLIVVANNRSFFNDELHQERVARARGRPVENRWIGQRIAEPDIDLAAMARAQGVAGYGPVVDASDLDGAFARALADVTAGRPAVVDVRVKPGYGSSNPSGAQPARATG